MNDEERLHFIAQRRASAQQSITRARQSVQTAAESLKQAERELMQCTTLGDLNAGRLAQIVRSAREQLDQAAGSLH